MRTAPGIRVAVLIAVAGGTALAEIPYKTRKEIVAYGATGIGSPYIWGGGNWDPNDRAYGGADCSGFVAKCWSLTKWTPYRVNYHGPYSTASFIQTPGAYWDEVDRSAMLYGDAIVYRYNNNQSGHTYIYLSGDGWGEHEVYEARGTAYGIVHRWRTVYSAADAAKGIRRQRILENIDVTEHIIEVDDGAPYYTDSGMTGSSSYDSYAPGCREGNGRYRWVTAVRNETCTYRPNLPESGWYRVYVTCNEGDPNVQGVGVSIHHTLGTDIFEWDQGYDPWLNTWVPMGDRSFLFAAGTAGTVVWDDVNATPVDGAHTFRGDATKFSLDNRVEVDGVGGAAGRFATLREAIAWIRSRESEEPDVIRITCNRVVETGCVVVDLWDDVTIEGDADNDGVPATVVVTPTQPADWARACALYLDVPIRRHYTLRDLVVIPNFVAAGYATGAYGIVIDEQNPSGEACAMSLTLENVTVAGSLPGNMPTDPQVNARTLATLFGGTDANYGASVLQRTSAWAGDDACRQRVTACGLTVTHSATRGIAITSAYTDWDVDGGLVVTFNGLEGVRADHLGGSTLTIRDSSGTRLNSIAGNLGGGLVNVGDAGTGTVSVSRCAIQANTRNQGGGIVSESATTLVRNSVVAGNSASGEGGAVYASAGSVTLGNCTIVGNTSGTGAGGIYSSGAAVDSSNSILWGNAGSQVQGSATVTYCDVQGGYAGIGNITGDPAFADPVSGDYHLRRTSPCINRGNPAFVPAAGETDIDGQPRVQKRFVDMGADETSFAAGDADADGDVDLADYAVFADCLAGSDATPAPTPPTTAAECLSAFDFDADLDVDLADFAEFQAAFTGP